MSLLALFGTGYNQLGRMVTPAVPSDADGLFPIANLYNGRPWEPFRFATSAAPSTIDFDLNQAVNGDFETAFSSGLPGAGWSLGTGGTTLARSSTAPYAGTYHLAVSGGVGANGRYRIEAAPGETLFVGFRGRNDGSGTAYCYIEDLNAGRYLLSDGTWTSTPTAFFSNATSSYNLGSATFTMPAYGEGWSDRPILQVQFFAGYWDAFVLLPQVSWVSLHGHNFSGAIEAVLLKSGSTSPGTTTRATLTLARTTLFATFAGVIDRYWRLYLSNGATSGISQVEVPWIGQLVLGQYQTLSRAQSYPYSEDRMEPQDRSEGGIAAYLRSTSGARELQLRFDYRAADYTQAKEMLERSRNGAHPLVLADSSDSASAMLCRVADKWQGSVQSNVLRQSSLTFTELPFPTVLP